MLVLQIITAESKIPPKIILTYLAIIVLNVFEKFVFLGSGNNFGSLFL